MEPLKVSSILTTVSALLNDTGRQIYNDTDMLPFFQIAYDDLRLQAENYNIPITNVTSAPITIEAGVTDIGGSTGPALPNDLVEILTINERVADTEDDYMLMKRVNFLPLNEVRTAYLGYWSWENQIVRFIGATGNIQVKLQYIANTLGEVVNGDTQLKYYNCRNFLQFRTAALCAQYLGENETRAESLNSQALYSIDTLLNIGIKSQQSIGARRRPYALRGRTRNFGGF